MRQLFTVLVLLLSFSAFSQNGFFVSGSLDFGGLGRTRFEQGGSVLSNQWLGTAKNDDVDFLFSAEAGVSYYFLKHFGISVNLKLNDKAAVFHDARFMNSNGISGSDFAWNLGKLTANSGNFNPNRNFLGPNFSAQYIFNNVDNASGPYLMAGVGMNRILGNKGHSTMSYFYEPTGESLDLKLNYRKSYPYGFVEIGYAAFTGYDIGDSEVRPKITTKGNTFSIGLRYTFAGAYMTADYQAVKNSSVEYTDRVTLMGSYFSVVLRFGGSIFGDRLDRRYAEVYTRSLEKENAEQDIQEEEIRRLGDRKVVVKYELIVRNPQVTVSFWDDQEFDKDIITVEFNGTALLEDYLLKRSKKAVELSLGQNPENLVIHAVSEGRRKPCTVAVMVDDGVTQQTIILSSTMQVSETISIKWGK